MNRKDKIIQESINLFNKNGCLNTTTRHIATKLNISVGNLYYYFKNKEEIVLSIYQNFIKSISSHLNSISSNIDSPFDYFTFVQNQIDYELKYRFFRLELNNIYQKYPKVRKALQEGVCLKKEQIKFVYTHQIKYEYMKKIDDSELEYLISNTWVIAAQWEMFWLLSKCEDELIRRKKGILNILYLIKPYMTQKGLEQTNLYSTIKYLHKEIEND